MWWPAEQSPGPFGINVFDGAGQPRPFGGQHGPEEISPRFPVATALVNASIRPASPPPWPAAAFIAPAGAGVISRPARVRKS
jgi:hypothetical protein